MAGPKAVAQYEQVRKKVEAGQPVVAAISEVAKETGVSAGTLQTAYYRVARETGTVKPRKSRKRATPKPSRAGTKPERTPRASKTGASDPSTAELLRQLADAAAALSARVAELERDSARLHEIEAALKQ